MVDQAAAQLVAAALRGVQQHRGRGMLAAMLLVIKAVEAVALDRLVKWVEQMRLAAVVGRG